MSTFNISLIEVINVRSRSSMRLFILILILQLANQLKFGKHHPNGQRAVNYMYSSDGFWKSLQYLDYTYDKFSAGNSNHILSPYDFAKVITRGQFLTCRDEEGHILGDFNKDGELYFTNNWVKKERSRS